jgi:hypothetical protein
MLQGEPAFDGGVVADMRCTSRPDASEVGLRSFIECVWMG